MGNKGKPTAKPASPDNAKPPIQIAADALYYSQEKSKPCRYFRVERVEKGRVYYHEIKPGGARPQAIESLQAFQERIKDRASCTKLGCKTGAVHVVEGENLCQFHTQAILERRFSFK